MHRLGVALALSALVLAGCRVGPGDPAELRRLPEAARVFPGAEVGWTREVDADSGIEGPTPAQVLTGYEVDGGDDDVEAVIDWYDEQLRAAGWTESLGGGQGTGELRVEAWCLPAARAELRLRFRDNQGGYTVQLVALSEIRSQLFAGVDRERRTGPG